MVRSRRKPIILHGCRGCGAKFDSAAQSDLNLKRSCNIQSVLRDLGWAADRRFRKSCLKPPDPALVPGFSYIIRSCREDLALRHPPFMSQTIAIYLQILDPSPTSFRTEGVSQRSEHDTPNLCKSPEWGKRGWQLECEK